MNRPILAAGLNLILIALLAAACSDPCAGQANSAGCQLALAQFQTTEQASQATAAWIAESTAVSVR